MAYDQKNHYPDKPMKPERQSVARKSQSNSGDEQDIKDRALDALRACMSDMEALQGERARYQKYYMGDKLGNEVEGRSQVVMSDVGDTVESIMPSLMRIFFGGRNVLDIRAQGREDEQKAKLMEEKVNFDVQKGLNGFKLIYNFIKDALIYKMGVVKYWWEDKTTYKPRSFKGLTHEEYIALANNPKYQIDSVKTTITNMMGQTVEFEGHPDAPLFMGEVMTHDVEAQEVKRISKPMAENVPPEEFVFDYKARELKDAFCAHKKRVHKNHLRKYGLDDEEIQEAIDEVNESTNTIVIERFRDLGGSSFIVDDKDKNFVYIYECYLDDYDEEGTPVPQKVVIFGNKVVQAEENTYGRPPFVVMSPIIIPHRVCGRGLAELVVEIQKLRTALVRYILDNIYFQSNGMMVVNPYRIDVDSLQDANRPGGRVFTTYDIDPSTAIFPVPVTQLQGYVMKMLEYIEGPVKENRTGITRYNQGLDGKSLNRTATGVTQIMNAAQQRVELVARIFSETGMRDLYQAFVDMNIEFFDIEVNLKINEQWHTVRKEDIDGEFDVIIDVGSSTGTKEMAYQQKMQMLNTYGMMAKFLGPATQGIFTLDNVKNIIRTMWEDLGYRNTDLYVAPDRPQGGAVGQPGQQQAMGMGGGGGPQAPGAPPPMPVLQPDGGADQGGAMGMPYPGF